MNEQLLHLQTKVTAIFYNPIINLKDQIKAVQLLIENKNEFNAEQTRFEAAIAELEQLEELQHGDINQIKGFNKTKTRVLKLIKEILQKVS